jgi:hypothetical protein
VKVPSASGKQSMQSGRDLIKKILLVEPHVKGQIVYAPWEGKVYKSTIVLVEYDFEESAYKYKVQYSGDKSMWWVLEDLIIDNEAQVNQEFLIM